MAENNDSANTITPSQPPAPGHAIFPGSLSIVPRRFALRNADFTVCTQRVFECSDQFDLEEYTSSVAIGRLSFKSSQSMQGLVELCEKGDGLARDQLKMGVRVLGNRFAENSEGTLTISHISLELDKELESKLPASAELSLFLVHDGLTLRKLDSLLEVVSYPPRQPLGRMAARLSGNLLARPITAATTHFRNCLLATISDRKNTYATFVIELMELPLDKFESTGFEVRRPTAVRGMGAKGTCRLSLVGNYLSHLLEMRNSMRQLRQGQEVKYRTEDGQ